MYYHVILRTVGGGFSLMNIDYDNLISKAIVPFINQQINLINYTNKEKALINFGSVTYLRIFKTENFLILDNNKNFLDSLPLRATECTQEIIDNALIKRTSLKPKSLLQIAFLPTRKQVFIIMEFNEPSLDSTYKKIIRPLIEEFNYRPIRIDEIENSGKISDQILEEIAKSEIILCDLTGERPNCYFEAGFALALGKEIILTIKEDSKIHFDLMQYRFIQWKTEGELKDKLHQRLKSIEEKINLIEERSDS